MLVRLVCLASVLLQVSSTSNSVTAAQVARVEAVLAGVDPSAAAGPTSRHPFVSSFGAHVPFLTVDATTGIATAGVRGYNGSSTALHVQEAAHFISDIWVKNEAGAVIHAATLDAANPDGPTTTFVIPSGTVSLRPYELCR